jgi:hypothetical protein
MSWMRPVVLLKIGKHMPQPIVENKRTTSVFIQQYFGAK